MNCDAIIERTCNFLAGAGVSIARCGPLCGSISRIVAYSSRERDMHKWLAASCSGLEKEDAAQHLHYYRIII